MFMRSLRRLSLFASAVILIGCQNPRVQANIAEAINEYGDQISGMQQDVAVLQGQVDSLKLVAARQDTMISRLATLAGIPVLR